MSKLFMLWHRPAIVDQCAYLFLKLGEDCCQKKNCRKVFIIMPEGIYNYETTGSGIQIIIELISGLFDSVHNLSVCGYAYQSDDV